MKTKRYVTTFTVKKKLIEKDLNFRDIDNYFSYWDKEGNLIIWQAENIKHCSFEATLYCHGDLVFQWNTETGHEQGIIENFYNYTGLIYVGEIGRAETKRLVQAVFLYTQQPKIFDEE